MHSFSWIIKAKAKIVVHSTVCLLTPKMKPYISGAHRQKYMDFNLKILKVVFFLIILWSIVVEITHPPWPVATWIEDKLFFIFYLLGQNSKFGKMLKCSTNLKVRLLCAILREQGNKDRASLSILECRRHPRKGIHHLYCLGGSPIARSKYTLSHITGVAADVDPLFRRP